MQRKKRYVCYRGGGGEVFNHHIRNVKKASDSHRRRPVGQYGDFAWYACKERNQNDALGLSG